MPLRVNYAGVMPIIFAQAILMFPEKIFMTLGRATGHVREAKKVIAGMKADIADILQDDPTAGTIVPMLIEMRSKSVVGTVIYVPGEPISTDRDIEVQVPAGSILTIPPDFQMDGMSDEEILRIMSSDNEPAVRVLRDERGDVRGVQYVQLDDLGLLESASLLDPGGRIKRYESYSVTGFIPETTPEMLQAAGTEYPEWVIQTYMQLPDTLPDRVREQADEWAGSAATPYDKAMAIQAKLREYRYTTRIGEPPPGADAVDWFLFTAGQGYFDYQASAMVVMLRHLGVPSRLAVGFALDDTDRDGTGSYVVKDKNSYAWPEVYFPGVGWVPFNPTQDRVADLTPRTDASGPIEDEGSIFDNLPAGSSAPTGPSCPSAGSSARASGASSAATGSRSSSTRS